MYYMGEYYYKFTNGKVDLPRKFQMARKDLIMRVVESEGFLSIQLNDLNSNEEPAEENMVVVLEEKKIHVPKNRCITLPEAYLNKVEITENSYIVILGLISKVEIFVINREAYDRKSMLSIWNAPGEALDVVESSHKYSFESLKNNFFEKI